MRLYEIEQALLELVDPETGEVLDWDAFEQLQMAKDAKIEGMACWFKNLGAEAAAIKAEEQSLKERRERLERKADRLKEYLGLLLGGEKFETARCAITFRKTTRVVVENEADFIEWAERNGRDDLVSYKTPTVNKTEVGKLLKAAVELPGAELVTGLSMGVK